MSGGSIGGEWGGIKRGRFAVPLTLRKSVNPEDRLRKVKSSLVYNLINKRVNRKIPFVKFKKI